MKRKFLSSFLAITMTFAIMVTAFPLIVSAETPHVTWFDEGITVVGDFHEGFAAAYIGEWPNQRWGIINQFGYAVIEFIYDEFPWAGWADSLPFSEGPMIVRLGDNWGAINPDGRIAVEFIYESIRPFYNGFAEVWLPGGMNGRRGIINQNGEIIVPIEYDNVRHFSEGLAAVNRDNRWGFYDKNGNNVVPIIYYGVRDFSGGLARVQLGTWPNQQFGFIDPTGAPIVPIIYDRAGSPGYGVADFHEGLTPAMRDGKWGFVGKCGTELIPFDYYEDVTNFSGGLAGVRRDGKWGFINQSNELIIPFQFNLIQNFPELVFSEGLTPVGMGSFDTGWKWGFVGNDGRIVIDIIYDEVGRFFDRFTWVQRGIWPNQQMGIIDKYGNYIIEIGEFSSVRPFRNGFAAVERNNLWGLINQYGEIVVPIEYTWHSMVDTQDFGFSENLLRVTSGEWPNQRRGFVNTAGEIVVPIIFNSIGQFRNGYAVVELDGRFGLLRNPLLPCDVSIDNDFEIVPPTIDRVNETITFTIENLDEEKRTLEIITAVFDEYERFTGFETITITIPAGESETETANFPINSRIFIWDMETMTPIINPIY